MKILPTGFFRLLCLLPLSAIAVERPNVVLIMADDLGYGDLSCYGATMVETPNIDQLAKEGLSFERYYTSGSVCIPTRYSMMTGFYPFRSGRHGNQIGSTEALLVPTERTTLATVFKQVGYKTAAIGKWHLGYGTEEEVDYSKELSPGPLELGFDYHWGLPRNHNDTVRGYVENGRLIGLDPNGTFQSGEFDRQTRSLKSPVQGLLEERQDDKVNSVLTGKVIDFIRENKEQPFFVFFTPTIPHTHVTPDAPFRGTSEAGQYGDFIQELDHYVGQITALLDELSLAENTIVIFTSDNGGQLRDHWTAGIGLNLADESGDVAQKSKKPKIEAGKLGHKINGHLRGAKAGRYEGGFNVPCIIRWPGKIVEGSRTSEIVSSPDYLTTFAELLGVKVPRFDAGDSFSFLRLLSGSQKGYVRSSVVTDKRRWKGYREGDWKLIHDYSENSSELFNLKDDPSETKNLAEAEPQRVGALLQHLNVIIDGLGHRLHDEYEIGYKLPEDAKVTYPDSNPLRNALKPVPESAVFKMEGWSLWDPSLIKVDDTYHLFCSRWPMADDHSFDSGWKRSHV
ncbi:MAG: sulfatase-like hydrolase/transferase, partial [Lentimonas sp.]